MGLFLAAEEKEAEGGELVKEELLLLLRLDKGRNLLEDSYESGGELVLGRRVLGKLTKLNLGSGIWRGGAL